jgi:archaellum component FlaF (FlaF/FlaG flagellin family)
VKRHHPTRARGAMERSADEAMTSHQLVALGTLYVALVNRERSVLRAAKRVQAHVTCVY